RNLASPATEGNLKQVETIRRRQMSIEQKRKEKLQNVADKLSRVSVDIVVEVDENDNLFGSVTPGQIAEALQKQGFEVNKKQIVLDEPIENLGVYNVTVRLHPEVEAKARVWVFKHEE
ncbi:50S ribosomal protein L9, partial [bacterium]